MDGNFKCSDDSKFIIKELRQIELTVQSLLKITEREELAIGGGKLFVKILSELNADVIITNSYFLKFRLQALLLVIIVFYWKIVDDSGVSVVAAVHYPWFWVVDSRVCDVLVGTVGLIAADGLVSGLCRLIDNLFGFLVAVRASWFLIVIIG